MGKNMEDYLKVARRIFEGTQYNAPDEDIRRLAENMFLLEKRGLDKLNKRLEDVNKHSNIFHAIAEHNFAIMLVSRYDSSIPIGYELYEGAPDFKVEIENITYWIQMKDLEKLKRENRQDKIIQQIKRGAKEIKVGKFFSCMLSDDFKKDYLLELIDFIKDKASSAGEGESFLFACNKNQRAEIKFWSAEKIALSELTLNYAGDLEMLEVTGQEKEQIKKSLLNAVGAFNWEADKSNINLIAMEADDKEDIDICDALFGTECEIVGKDSQAWSRKDDGLFSNADFSKKVAGVIIGRRKPEKCKLSSEEEIRVKDFAKECNMTPELYKEQIERKSPVTDYRLILYMNNRFKLLLENIKKLLSFDMVVYYNMRPPMKEGNFRLSLS